MALINMLHLHFDPFPVLETPRLALDRITDQDLETIFVLRSDSQVLAYINKTPATSMAEAQQFLQIIDDALVSNAGITWGIFLKGTQQLIGTIALWRIVPQHMYAEIGYSLVPAYFRKGIMQEAIKEVIIYGFEVMKLHRIEANINPANEASRALLLRNGFIQEAFIKENYYFDGLFYDTAMFSLLNSQQ